MAVLVVLAMLLVAPRGTCQAQEPALPGQKPIAGQTAADYRETRSSHPPRNGEPAPRKADRRNAPRNADRQNAGTLHADRQSARQSRRRAMVQVAALALVGILLLGAFLLALPIVWGHRLRRMSRQPASSCAPLNPLWFLKPPQPKAGEARTGEEEFADEERDATPGPDEPSSSEPDGRGPA